MIVRNDGDQLFLITQIDHAALAADILAAVRRPEWLARPTRESVLFATRHHDEGWREEDARPTLDAAHHQPFDFLTLPVAHRQAVWTRGTARLALTSSYVAALLAQHALTVFRRSRPDPDWHEFFRTMDGARNEFFDRASRPDFQPTLLDPPAEHRVLLLQDYGYLAWADLVSLVLCNAWTETLEVDEYRVRGEGTTVVVSPDPFGGHVVNVRVRARRIARTECLTDEGLQQAVTRAPFDWIVGRVVGRTERR